MDLILCPCCDRMFNDLDNSGVCPNGHSTRDLADDDDSYPLGEVTI